MQTNTNWPSLHSTHFRNIPVLITGGAGFIGSHLVEVLSILGARITVLDDLSGGSADNIVTFSNTRLVQGSILDVDLLNELTQGCRYVFHQAALGSVPRSVEQPRLYNDVNITGTLNVLEAARLAKVGRVMFAASSSAYGNSETLPKIESMPPLPQSPYAATKLAGEGLLRAYSASYGLDTVSLRYFNIFGPRQNANSAYAAVIAAFAKALSPNQSPTIFGDGEQSRDFTFVHNAVHANLLAARSIQPLKGEVINVAIGQRITVTQLATQIAKLLGKSHLAPTYQPTRAGDVKHSLADLTLAKKLLNYSPIVDFNDGCATVEWYRETMKG